MNKIDELLAELEGPVKSIRAMREAAATIRALREALKPFAQAAEDCIDEGDRDSSHTWEHHVGMNVTVGDFRKAAAALEASHGRVGK